MARKTYPAQHYRRILLGSEHSSHIIDSIDEHLQQIGIAEGDHVGAEDALASLAQGDRLVAYYRLRYATQRPDKVDVLVTEQPKSKPREGWPHVVPPQYELWTADTQITGMVNWQNEDPSRFGRNFFAVIQPELRTAHEQREAAIDAGAAYVDVWSQERFTAGLAEFEAEWLDYMGIAFAKETDQYASGMRDLFIRNLLGQSTMALANTGQ